MNLRLSETAGGHPAASHQTYSPAANPGNDTTRGIDKLLPHHRSMLEDESAISSDVIEARGYRSLLDQAEARALGFADYQCSVPGVYFPVWNAHGTSDMAQLRPDNPRCRRDGKVIKYETMAGGRMCIDVHPFVRPHLANPAIDLWITEGIKKGDALVSAGECAVALLGVWNFRGTNAHGGKAILPCFESIPLNGRRVFIAYDSDVMQKSSVQQALLRLGHFLQSRQAVVHVVDLADEDGDATP
jgi:hypothetical protein